MNEIISMFSENKLITAIISLSTLLYWIITRIRGELKEEKTFLREKLLTSDKTIESFKDEIKALLKHNSHAYRETLTKVLTFLDTHLGSLKPFSAKAWQIHIKFSIVYSFLFFYLVWLLGGIGQIGTHTLLLDSNRLGITLYLIFEVVTLYLLFTKIDTILEFFIRKLPYFSRLSNTWKEIVVGVVVVGVGVGVVVE
ncbi:MAG: hypothetical protein Q9M36_12150 [Sulfurovum sp.]|nr:hypothetical protein [Sulfurovum sp.]